MNYLDDFLIGPQSDEYDDEFWFWSDFQDLEMGISNPEGDVKDQKKLMFDK